MECMFISLPIELTSNELLSSITGKRTSSHSLVCYSIRKDTMGFSGIYSSLDTEIICESEEEFQNLIAERKLMRIL